MIKALTIGLLLKATDQASGPVKGLSREVGKIGSEADVSASKMSRLAAPIKAVASTLNRIGVEAEAAARKVKPLTDKLDKLKDYGKEVAEHTLVPGAVMAGSLGYTVKDFSELEAARNSLVVGMMEKGGKVDMKQYAGLSGLAEQLGKDYMGSSKDFYKTFRVLIEQGITAEKITGGVGKAVADFSAVTGEAYDTAAFKLAKFHDSLGIAAGDMPKFAEEASKARFAFGLNTEELYTALPYMTAGLKALKIQGLEGANTVLRLSGIMARAGIPSSEIGTSVGQVINRMADFNMRLGKNSKVMREIRGILAGTGIEMNFWDKKGNFLGPENMIAQFEKLNRLAPQKRMEVQKGLFGDVAGRGVSILGDVGVKGWRESDQMMLRQASLAERVLSIQETLIFKWDSFTGTIATFRAEIGEAVSKSIFLKGALDGLNDTFGSLTTWMREHKTIAGIMATVAVSLTGLLLITGTVGATVAGVAKFAAFSIGGWARAFGALNGVLKFMPVNLKSAIIGFRMLTVTMSATPIGLALVAIAAAGLLVYTYWKPIKAFIGGLWQGFKEGLAPLKEVWKVFKSLAGPVISPLIGYLKQLLVPLGFTGKTLGTITFWGKAIGYVLSAAFTMPIYALIALKKMLFNTADYFKGGFNIAKTIGEGILKGVAHPVQAIKTIAEKVRRFLPFSPAKEGPLRDIHRIKLVETIASSVKPEPLVRAMRTATAAAMKTLPIPAGAITTGASQGAAINVSFSPTINVNGSPASSDMERIVMDAIRKNYHEFERLLNEVVSRRERRSF